MQQTEKTAWFKRTLYHSDSATRSQLLEAVERACHH